MLKRAAINKDVIIKSCTIFSRRSSSLSKGIVRSAVPSDFEQIVKLRLSAYSRAKEFEIHSMYGFKPDDITNKEIILLVEDDKGEILSTMRGELFKSQAELPEYLLHQQVLDDALFPMLFLSRAATALHSNNTGLNSILRYYFFKSALNNNTNTVAGTVFEGATRINLLKDLGYSFMPIRHGAQYFLKARAPALFAYLPSNLIEAAIKHLENKFDTVLKDFPVKSDAISNNYYPTASLALFR